MKRMWVAFAVLLLTATSAIAQDFRGCPVDGDGGDAALNRLKNRTDLPTQPAVEHLDELLVSLPVLESVGKQRRDKWSNEVHGEVDSNEERGVRVIGYIIAQKHEGPESPNCHLDTDRDYHVWLANSPDDEKAAALVIEITPRVAVHHARWAAQIATLAKRKARARITGWLMFDQEHPEQIGKTRASRWEIHPITKIEVWSKPQGKPGRWTTL